GGRVGPHRRHVVLRDRLDLDLLPPVAVGGDGRAADVARGRPALAVQVLDVVVEVDGRLLGVPDGRQLWVGEGQPQRDLAHVVREVDRRRQLRPLGVGEGAGCEQLAPPDDADADDGGYHRRLDQREALAGTGAESAARTVQAPGAAPGVL